MYGKLVFNIDHLSINLQIKLYSVCRIFSSIPNELPILDLSIVFFFNFSVKNSKALFNLISYNFDSIHIAKTKLVLYKTMELVSNYCLSLKHI